MITKRTAKKRIEGTGLLYDSGKYGCIDDEITFFDRLFKWRIVNIIEEAYMAGRAKGRQEAFDTVYDKN